MIGETAEVAGLADRLHRRYLDDARSIQRGVAEPDRAGLVGMLAQEAPLLDERVAGAVIDAALARMAGLGPLEPWLADPCVTDVMVNGGGQVWVDRAGVLTPIGLLLDESTVLHLIERIVAPLGLHVDRSRPMVDARLADGSRVHAVIPPLAVDGPCLTIRRFGARPIGLTDVAGRGVVAMLEWAVLARANIVISGGAGAGKTTLLNALAAGIGDGERVVTIEDAAELRLPGAHVVRLEGRPPNAEGQGEVRIRDLVRAALRMRPDRIVVGEVRGGEAIDMLQALNTGHAGSLSTCHANHPADALRRLETLVLMGDLDLPHAAIRDQIASAVDLVVHVERDPRGRRRVTAVAEVGTVDDHGRLGARLLTDADRLVALPRRPVRLAEAGAPDPAWLDR